MPLQALAVASDAILFIGVAVGYIATWGWRARLLPIYLAAIYFSTLQIVLHSEARFRLPLIPLFCLFFGWGAVELIDERRRHALCSYRSVQLILGVMVSAIVLVYAYTGWLFLSGKI